MVQIYAPGRAVRVTFNALPADLIVTTQLWGKSVVQMDVSYEEANAKPHRSHTETQI